MDPDAVWDGKWGRARMGVLDLDGGGDRRKGRDSFGVNLGRPIVTNVEQILVGISAVMLVVFYHRLEYTLRDIQPLCENMMSSTKPEVHNVSERR